MVLEIRLSRLSRKQLYRESQHYYRQHFARHPSCKNTSREGMKEFQDRNAVNYLRHTYTNYETTLSSYKRLYGAIHPLTYELKEEILEAIAAHFPYLQAECARQRHELEAIKSYYLNV